MNGHNDKTTLGQVVDTIKKLDSKVDAGFKQVNTRLDRVESRLDYIVEENNLKDNK